VAKHAQSRALVPHPDQFRGVASAAAAVRGTTPLGHQVAAPLVVRRDLREYDRLYGVSGVTAGGTSHETTEARQLGREEEGVG
jgi:hypothetical protein